MPIARSILLLMSGATAGIALVISCGRNSHSSADAAIDASAVADAGPSCDCPAAEPPLAGRVVVVSQLRVYSGNSYGGYSARCPLGALLISGSCGTDLSNPLRNVTLMGSTSFGVPPVAWDCTFRNNEFTPVTFRASAICLGPAP
jgi:hypothetical protein